MIMAPEILNHIWAELRRGVDDSKHPYHQAVLATLDEHSEPTQRTLVLRALSDRTLLLHTDARSAKLEQVRRRAKVSLLFYNPTSRIQLALRGTYNDELSRQLHNRQWESTTLMSRRCYLAPYAPGQQAREMVRNLPDELIARRPDAKESAAGKVNFAVMAIVIEEIDSLRLSSKGHTRIRFSWQDSRWQAQWFYA